MRKNVQLALAAGVILGGLGLAGGAASALPVGGLDPAIAVPADAQGLQDVRWVCGPYGCRWVPGPYWGPRWGHPYWGWGHRWGYGHWRRW
jgi:hypothetical protein